MDDSLMHMHPTSRALHRTACPVLQALSCHCIYRGGSAAAAAAGPAGGAASYAQAAMAGTRAGAEAAAREAGHPPPHPNLSFSTGGRPLPGPTSIFQAVQVARQQQQGADAQAAGADPLQARFCYWHFSSRASIAVLLLFVA